MKPDFITHDPLLCCSLSLLPTIPCFAAVWLSYPQSPAGLEFGSIAPNFFQTQNLSPLLPLQAWKPHYPQCLEAQVWPQRWGARVSRASFSPAEEGPAIERWVALLSQVLACLGQAPSPASRLGPGSSTPGGPGEG